MDRRRRAGRISCVRRWAVLFLLAIAAGCGEEQAARGAPPTPISSREHGFSGRLPAGWEVARKSLTPNLRNPVEILSAGTQRGLRDLAGTSGNLPLTALQAMGPRDAFVTLQESYGDARFANRPAHFALPDEPPPTVPSWWADRNAEWLDVYWFDFADARRAFYVLVAIGREAPPERRAEALALLDSLRFEPGPEGVHIDSDLAVRFTDEGLAWLMPVPPWRHYDWPLTSVRAERLALGTFELERTPPDPDCTPRAAIDALPADGAFIYVFERPEGSAAPDSAGELRLGPATSWECLGRSRRVRWRVDGRVLQAHVLLGPQAGPRLEQQARSILNSIEVD
jgi:hypothetical protein